MLGELGSYRVGFVEKGTVFVGFESVWLKSVLDSSQDIIGGVSQDIGGTVVNSEINNFGNGNPVYPSEERGTSSRHGNGGSSASKIHSEERRSGLSDVEVNVLRLMVASRIGLNNSCVSEEIRASMWGLWQEGIGVGVGDEGRNSRNIRSQERSIRHFCFKKKEFSGGCLGNLKYL